MFARSSVARFPAAPGANGHPPRPPIQLSNFLIPSVIAEDCVGDRDDSAHKSNLIDLQLKYADVMHSDEIFN